MNLWILVTKKKSADSTVQKLIANLMTPFLWIHTKEERGGRKEERMQKMSVLKQRMHMTEKAHSNYELMFFSVLNCMFSFCIIEYVSEVASSQMIERKGQSNRWHWWNTNWQSSRCFKWNLLDKIKAWS